MPLPLILAGLGLAKGLYEANRKDPNRGLYTQLEKQAKGLRQEASSDVGGAMQANIRNQIANRIYGTQAAGVAKGRGSSPTTQAQVASLASMGAGQENQALMYGDERSRNLNQQASGLLSNVSQMRGGFNEGRKQNAFGAYAGGLTGALGAQGEILKAAESKRRFDLLSGLMGGQQGGSSGSMYNPYGLGLPQMGAGMGVSY